MILLMKNLSHVSLVFVYGFLALEQVSVLGKGFHYIFYREGLGRLEKVLWFGA